MSIINATTMISGGGIEPYFEYVETVTSSNHTSSVITIATLANSNDYDDYIVYGYISGSAETSDSYRGWFPLKWSGGNLVSPYAWWNGNQIIVKVDSRIYVSAKVIIFGHKKQS